MKNKEKPVCQRGRKIFVGMSGGVDSSLTAALLLKEGYDVTGVFIKVWQPDFVECSWREDRLDAMRVCAKLGINFLDLDLEEVYKREVFDYMIEEYKNGRTPNPDVMCNKKIKFGAFLDFALKNGVDFVATGHYVRLEDKKLLAGIDENKDQSYFLWTLTQEQLKHCIFPIGQYTKPEVRKLAKKFELSTADKKDSQGLCFVGKVDMKDFLERFIPQKKGDVLNEKGKVIGHHDGIHYFTLGQRHGFEIIEKGTEDKPYYVVAKDLEKNILIVSNQDKQNFTENLKRKEIKLENINWTLGEKPNFFTSSLRGDHDEAVQKKYQARIRYRQPLQECVLVEKDRIFSVVFDIPQKNVASGQSVVIYDEDICLGGGVIV
ncbi:MAG: tRNA 2-thiouridine(34) synthase MnmA [Patescibacteria group bacterium]